MEISEQKKEALKLTTLMSFSAVIGKILSFPGGIVTAKFLGPALYGVLAIINLIRQYTGYIHFGLLQTLPRDVPIAYGKGDKKEARLITDSVFSGFFFASTIGVVGLWLLFIFGVTFKGALNVPILILISLIFIANRIHTFLNAYIKAEGKFIIIGKLDFINKLITPALIIPAVIFFKLMGVLFATLLIETIMVGYLVISLKKPKFHFYLKIKKISHLLKIGFMIFINKISDNLFESTGLIILTAMMTTRDVGLYSIAFGITLAKKIPFAHAIHMTVYRKMMVEAGKFGTDKVKHFRKYTERLLSLYLMFNSLILGCMILLYMIIIKTILIDYTESLPLMLILYFGYLIYTSRVFLSFYLNVTNQLQKRLGIMLVGLGLNASLSYFLITKGYGVKGVAFSCSLSFIIVAIIIMAISFKQIYGNIRHTIYSLLKIFSISAILTALLAIFHKFNIFDYVHLQSISSKILLGVSDLIVKGIIFSALCISIFLLFYKKHRLFDEIKVILSYVVHSFMERIKKLRRSRYTGKEKTVDSSF